MTYTYPTVEVPAIMLSDKDVLVGECEGLSAVFGVAYKNGKVTIETEHGYLDVPATATFTVLGEE